MINRQVRALGRALCRLALGTTLGLSGAGCGGDQVCRDGFAKVQQCVQQLDCNSPSNGASWCSKVKVYFDRDYDSWLSSVQQKRHDVSEAYACSGVVAEEWGKIVDCELDSTTCGCVAAR